MGERADPLQAKQSGRAGVTFENTSREPLVTLRYFGPDAHAVLPEDA